METARPAETGKSAEAPQDTAADQVEKTTDTGELKEVRPAEETGEDDSVQGEAAELTEQVFHDVKAAPIKVAEHYEPVDTQEPEMDAKLANTILDAAANGVEKMQIQLTPANLGSITIDLTRDANGALEVVIHATTSKAAGLLSQHLDGLHTALQSYGGSRYMWRCSGARRARSSTCSSTRTPTDGDSSSTDSRRAARRRRVPARTFCRNSGWA